MMNHRSQGTTPEILKNQNLELFLHDDLKNWQKMNKGIRFLNEERNTEYFGLVDDVLVNKMGELVMVDTKSTSKKEEMTTLENVFNNGKTYQRQLEIYSYLFQKNGFPVNYTGYLLYYNAIKGESAFNGIMRFKTSLIPMKLDTSWIQSCLENLHECLQKDEAPPPLEDCDFCLSNLLKRSLQFLRKKIGREKQIDTRKELSTKIFLLACLFNTFSFFCVSGVFGGNCLFHFTSVFRSSNSFECKLL